MVGSSLLVSFRSLVHLLPEFPRQDFEFSSIESDGPVSLGKGLRKVNVMATSTDGHLAGHQTAC